MCETLQVKQCFEFFKNQSPVRTESQVVWLDESRMSTHAKIKSIE